MNENDINIIKLLNTLSEPADEYPEELMDKLKTAFGDNYGTFSADLQNYKKDLRYFKSNDDIEDISYSYESDSGFDLRSTIDIRVNGQSREMIPTGIFLDIPDGYEIQVRPKSGLAWNNGIMVLNTPGTVDSGYNGEIKVIIFNTSLEPFFIKKGMKIAQAVLCPVLNGRWVNLVKVNSLDKKDRNDNGFGSTGEY